MKQSLLIGVLLLLFGAVCWGQVFSDDFTGLTTGTNLAGQSSWTKGGSGPDATVDNATPLTFSGYNGGGGEYVVMPTGTGTASRVYKTFTSPVTFASGSTIYFSVLLRLTSTNATGTAYFMSFGSPATGTNYGGKLFAITNGAGFNIGISKTSNTAAFGTTVLSLNTTYLIVARYTFHNLGIATGDNSDDEAYLWVNPSLASEPSIGTAECSIASGTGGTDYDGFSSPPTQVGNFIWHSRAAANPTGAFDAVRVGYGTTSADAWTSLNPGIATSVRDGSVGLPHAMQLYPAYPNPFNPSTVLDFTVAQTGLAKLTVFNILGQKVATLFDGVAVAGQVYKNTFAASRLASGVYFTRLESNRQVQIQKLVLMK